ncbi:sensor histidine kinase [Puia sp. P3]|uniref:sensor histidine kinase n=1 Tax=Puia sp. P3 TaxID=3423952 RepID=UPI003D663D91
MTRLPHLILWLLLSCGVCTGLVLAVVYGRYRVRRLLGENERLLTEREWLLREVHHRVRNNLQVIISLLKMQAANLKDEAALSAFGDLSARIYTISLLHQQLYQDRIDMPGYVRQLVDFLEEGRRAGHRILFRLEIAPVRLALGQSVPVGLILNEAISNAMKYAFPPTRASAGGPPADPEITITLAGEGPAIRLSVRDNGVGLPADYDIGRSASMGLPLIRMLATQLEGEMIVEGGAGVTIVVVFRRADDSGFLS